MNTFPKIDGRMLVVFDGQCGFCNRSVRWLMHRDREDQLIFAPSNHPALTGLLARHNIPPQGSDTLLVFLDPNTLGESLLIRSDATIACLSVLPRPWPAIAVMLTFIPAPLRDRCYRFIARNRYRVLGRATACPIPTAAESSHFLQ